MEKMKDEEKLVKCLICDGTGFDITGLACENCHGLGFGENPKE